MVSGWKMLWLMRRWSLDFGRMPAELTLVDGQAALLPAAHAAGHGTATKGPELCQPDSLPQVRHEIVN